MASRNSPPHYFKKKVDDVVYSGLLKSFSRGDLLLLAAACLDQADLTDRSGPKFKGLIESLQKEGLEK